MTWQIMFAKAALKEAKKVAAAGFKPKVQSLLALVQSLLALLSTDPFYTPPPFEKLVGDLSGAYSRRINIQHRLVYEVFVDEQVVRVLRMWVCYD